MEKEVLNYKPKNWFLDDKNGKYYRNRDLNSNSLKIKYLRNISNYIVSLKNCYEKISQVDVHDTISSELQEFNNDINHIEELLEIMCNKVTEEKNNMVLTDYDKIIDMNVKNIVELEGES
jgi:hypothetical protein